MAALRHLCLGTFLAWLVMLDVGNSHSTCEVFVNECHEAYDRKLYRDMDNKTRCKELEDYNDCLTRIITCKTADEEDYFNSHNASRQNDTSTFCAASRLTTSAVAVTVAMACAAISRQ